MGTEAIENSAEALLRPRTFGCGTQVGQFGFESIGTQDLSPPPTAGIGDDFVDAVVDGDRTGIGLESEATADVAVGDTVAVAIEVQAEIFVNERLDRVAMVSRWSYGMTGRGGEPRP
jgi:hypothetical protein